MNKLKALSIAGLLAVMASGFAPTTAHAIAILDTQTYDGHTYYLLGRAATTGASRDDFEAYALTLGGHLATVNDAAENNFLFTTFSAGRSEKANLWIGLAHNAASAPGTFAWFDGEPVGYTNWFGGEPSGIETGTAILTAGRSDSFGRWFDIDSPATNSFGFDMEAVVEVVPAPGSLALLGLGLAGFGFLRRKEQR